MRKLLLSLLLTGCVLPGTRALYAQSFLKLPEAAAETGASGPRGWPLVQALAPNTLLHLQARTRTLHCRLQNVDADALTCVSAGKSETYQRSDIKSIKVPHRTRSAVVGLAAGTGMGAIIGAAAAGGSTNFDLFSRGEIAGIFAIPFAFLGAIVGALTDFTSSTIYRA